ncbi:hypothetical protein BGX28_010156 [Mortierella sp. GBA30]|nr:hypothetical protein BGX28_010156 [Mortierella sp. GBA30]
MVRLLLGLAVCTAMAFADVTFNVVGLREDADDEFGVLINGHVTKLTTSKEAYPLWSANIAGVDGPLVYKYVQLNKGGKVEKQEKIARKLPAYAVYTPNEFFDRSNTIHDLPRLPQVYENNLEQNSPFFREGYIGNVFVEGHPDQIKYINTGGGDFHPHPIKVKVQYIGANDNVRVSNATFNLSGGSAREYSKLQYKIKFPKYNRLLDLASIKLRTAESDASMMREMLYIDILNALGVHTQQGAYVRLFINHEPIGLFVGLEEMKKHWIKKVLHPNVKKTKAGSLWKMNSCCGNEGNLNWLGPTTKDYAYGEIYKNVLHGTNPKDDPMKDLIQFMADLKHYDPKNVKDPIAYWEQRLDLDMFLKSMAMEFLSASWDSYWHKGSNYQFYNDPITGKWTWLPIDFDDTFNYENAFSDLDSYREVPKINAKGFGSPLAQKLIMETPVIKKRFEAVLKDIVTYVFKPEAVGPRLDGYKTMIEEDVAWDRKLPRVSKGESKHFNIQDLTKGIISVKNFVKKRGEQAEKDLKFKAMFGNPSKIEYHAVNKLESAFGIVPKEASVPAPVNTNKKNFGNLRGVKAVAKTEEKDDGKKENEPTTRGTSVTSTSREEILNSADMLRVRWAVLSVVVAMAAVAL